MRLILFETLVAAGEYAEAEMIASIPMEGRATNVISDTALS